MILNLLDPRSAKWNLFAELKNAYHVDELKRDPQLDSILQRLGQELGITRLGFRSPVVNVVERVQLTDKKYLERDHEIPVVRIDASVRITSNLRVAHGSTGTYGRVSHGEFKPPSGTHAYAFVRPAIALRPTPT